MATSSPIRAMSQGSFPSAVSTSSSSAAVGGASRYRRSSNSTPASVRMSFADRLFEHRWLCQIVRSAMPPSVEARSATGSPRRGRRREDGGWPTTTDRCSPRLLPSGSSSPGAGLSRDGRRTGPAAAATAINESLDHLTPWMAWASEPATEAGLAVIFAAGEELWDRASRLRLLRHRGTRRARSSVVAVCTVGSTSTAWRSATGSTSTASGRASPPR